MSREYQNGDGFGYLLSFRRQGSTSWQTARVPGADARHFVYSNDSVQPYTPFEVKIRSYNRRGDGPESLTTLVHSAEEGGPPHPQLPGRGVGGGSVLLTPHLDSTPGGEKGHLASSLAPSCPPQAWEKEEGGSAKRSGPGGRCENPHVASSWARALEIPKQGQSWLADSL